MTLAYIYSSDSICWLKYITHWGIIYEQHFPVNLDTVTHIFRYHEYIFEESKEHYTYNGYRDIHQFIIEKNHWYINPTYAFLVSFLFQTIHQSHEEFWTSQEETL